MVKRIISLILLCLIASTFLTSCDSGETGVVINEPVKVAVGIESTAAINAAKHYSEEKGYEIIEYETLQAAVIAVENGVADYVVIDEYIAADSYISTTDIKYFEDSGFSINYCAILRKDSAELHKSVNYAIEELNTDGVLTEIKKCFKSGKNNAIELSGAINGELKVLCAPVFDNLLYFDESGDLVGIEKDIINAIADKLSVTPELIFYDTVEDMFEALENGEGDIIISALEYTDARNEQYLLSPPYNSTQFAVYKRNESK